MYEYTEEWVNLVDGWSETLNKLADDGWQLKFVLVDETMASGTHVPGQRRLIFERRAS